MTARETVAQCRKILRRQLADDRITHGLRWWEIWPPYCAAVAGVGVCAVAMHCVEALYPLLFGRAVGEDLTPPPSP